MIYSATHPSYARQLTILPTVHSGVPFSRHVIDELVSDADFVFTEVGAALINQPSMAEVMAASVASGAQLKIGVSDIVRAVGRKIAFKMLGVVAHNRSFEDTVDWTTSPDFTISVYAQDLQKLHALEGIEAQSANLMNIQYRLGALATSVIQAASELNLPMTEFYKTQIVTGQLKNPESLIGRMADEDIVCSARSQDWGVILGEHLLHHGDAPGETLVAVGAMHLAGHHGLIQQLLAAGFDVFEVDAGLISLG